MRITLLCIGKTGKDFLVAGEQEYLKRLNHYLKAQREEIPDIKNAKKLSFEEIKQKEGELILQKIDSSDFVVLMDEKGEMMSSVKFSEWIQKRMNSGLKHLVFVIGGAYGFSSDVYRRADAQISLSKMTFSHQMIRMLFVEQLYRAMTILKGEPYHHE